MAANDSQFTSLSMDPPSNHDQPPPSVDNNTRAGKYNVNSNGNPTPFFASKWFAIVMIAISVGLLVVCIVLAIVLAVKVKSTADSTSAPIAPTSGTTTATATASGSQTFVLQCNPDLSANSKKNAETRQGKNQQTKTKLPVAPERIGNNILLKNTYMVEFSADVDVENHFRTVTNTLRESNQIYESEIELRHVIRSSLFNGASFSVTANDSIEASKIIEDALNIHPVYLIPAPHIIKSSFSSDKSIDTDSYLINAFDLTGVAQVHNQFQNFGKGVRVAVIDSGVDYMHPALGGCFGPGCKVAFGYDFAGDGFSLNNPTAVADTDPMDNCSESSHGTHVAGIIAANITGINDTYFIPSVPFSGVAPDVTIGAYRVFGCAADNAGSDLITAAIYRAYDDKADIITISIGGAAAYTESAEGIAIQRVTDMGVYITVAMGNDGAGGLETTSMPSATPSAMAIASADNTYTLRYVIIAPDGYKILYDIGAAFGEWTLVFNSTIVVNNPSGGPNDGCSNLTKSVNGTVVLFAYDAADSCNSAFRCNQAANVGALGCLLYNINGIAGSSVIPSGSISLADGQRIISTVTANPSAVYTFTNLLELSSVTTAGTPSSFSSLGLTGDLLIKPQLTGIGGLVYSTISVASAVDSGLQKPYNILSGTSMATPYVAGVLALFLASIGNPAPYTISGYAQDGKCRPKFPLVMNIFQSSATTVEIYNMPLLATTAQQGAGLVNAFQAITATTIFSPSELGLNDTVRRATSYTVSVINIGNVTAVYKMSHRGAALAIGKSADDDQLLDQPIYSEDYAVVTIDPTEFMLQSGYSREITLQFAEPSTADPAVLPIYSGFIYATNQVNGEVAHMFYAGVVGDYGNALIFVRNSISGVITGIQKADGSFVSDGEMPSLNATKGMKVQAVLAWPTRMMYAEVVPANGDVLVGWNVSSGLVFFDKYEGPAFYYDLPRNIAPTGASSYPQSYSGIWYGNVVFQSLNGSTTDVEIDGLYPGEYQIQFSALKHFGNPSNPDAFEVYLSPAFSLMF